MAAKARIKTVPRIEVNRGWCKGCGICIAFCPRRVLEAGPDGKPLVVRPEDCIRCELCELRCPDYAIELLGGEEDEPATAR